MLCLNSVFECNLWKKVKELVAYTGLIINSVKRM